MSVAQIDAAIAATRKRAEAAGERRSPHAKALIDLGILYGMRRGHSGRKADADDAVAALETALRLIPQLSPDRQRAELLLATLQVVDLRADAGPGLDVLRRGLAQTRPGTHQHAMMAARVGVAQLAHFLTTRDGAEWSTACELLAGASEPLWQHARRAAGQLAELELTMWATVRAQLALALLEPSAPMPRRQRAALVDEIIAELQARTPDTPMLAAVRDAYQRVRIVDGTTEVGAGPAAGHPPPQPMTAPPSPATGPLAPMFGPMNSAMSHADGLFAYAFEGDLRQLDEIIASPGHDLDRPDPDDPDDGTRLASMAGVFHLRSTVRRMSRLPGGEEDLARALDLARRAHAAPNRLPGPSTAMVLGRCLIDWYATGRGGPGTIDDALSHLHAAEMSAGPGPMRDVAIQCAIGEALMFRAHRDGNPADLDRAVDVIRRSRDRMPQQSAQRPMMTARLAASLATVAEATGETDDVLRAAQEWTKAVRETATVSLIWAYDTALIWANWSWRRGLRRETADAHAAAVTAMSRLARAQLNQSYAMVALRRISDGVTARATAALARERRYADAAVAAETGRAVLLTTALQRELAVLEAPQLNDLGTRYKRLAGHVADLERALFSDIATR